MRGGLAAKAPLLGIGFVWISLDSLVRIETFQWDARDKSRKVFYAPFAVLLASSRREGAALNTRKRARLVMRRAYRPFGLSAIICRASRVWSSWSEKRVALPPAKVGCSRFEFTKEFGSFFRKTVSGAA
jgi:hypothetical protein